MEMHAMLAGQVLLYACASLHCIALQQLLRRRRLVLYLEGARRVVKSVNAVTVVPFGQAEARVRHNLCCAQAERAGDPRLRAFKTPFESALPRTRSSRRSAHASLPF